MPLFFFLSRPFFFIAAPFIERSKTSEHREIYSAGQEIREPSARHQSRERAIRVESEALVPVTDEAGVHHVIKYAGQYVQYSYDPAQDCSHARYDTVNEIHALDPATAVKTRVMLVPDKGGNDTLRRRRFWWYRKMFHH